MWDKDEKVLVWDSKKDPSHFLMWVQDYEYSEERDGWEYKLRDKDGNLWEKWVREKDMKVA